MAFNVLSERMQWVQFRAQNIFQELKEEEQWNKHYGHKIQANVQAVAKSDAAVQVEPEKTIPKTTFKTRTVLKKEQTVPNVVHQVKKNTGFDSSATDLYAILEKLENLQSIVLGLKSSQSPAKRIQDGQDESTVPKVIDSAKYPVTVDRSALISQSLASVLARNEENEMSGIKTTKSKGVGYLLPYCLREERMLAKRAVDRSKFTKLPVKVVNNKSMLGDRKQVKFSTVAASKEINEKPKLMRKISKLNQNKSLQPPESALEESTPEIPVDQNTKAVGKAVLDEGTKWDANEITILEERMKEIEELENSVRQRISSLKGNSSPVTKYSEKTSLIPSQQNENIRKKDPCPSNSTPIGGDINVKSDIKETVEKKSDNVLPVNAVADFSTDGQVTSPNDVPVHSRRTDISINASVLKSIHHHRKLYGQYLHKIAHKKAGNFNPWTVADEMSDLILDDCLEEVAQELNKIPSSFIVDIYNQEFAQSLS